MCLVAKVLWRKSVPEVWQSGVLVLASGWSLSRSWPDGQLMDSCSISVLYLRSMVANILLLVVTASGKIGKGGRSLCRTGMSSLEERNCSLAGVSKQHLGPLLTVAAVAPGVLLSLAKIP